MFKAREEKKVYEFASLPVELPPLRLTTQYPTAEHVRADET